MIERIKKWLRYPSLSELAHDERITTAAQVLVRVYYLMLPVLAFPFFTTWSLPLRQQNFDPLWPLTWTSAFSLSDDTTVIIIRSLFVIAVLLGVVCYRYRTVRILVFLALWQVHAFESSFGAINHQWYLWVFTSGIFIFLPDLSRLAHFAERRIFLLCIWWAQATVMLSYSVSGFWKIEIALKQFLHGHINGFSPYAFSYQVADWLPKLQSEALLGPFVIDHPFLVWPIYLFMLYMQLFAFWSIVRPSLQMLWAFELVLFHFGTYVFMGISFWQHIPLLLVLFFISPFSPTHTSWRVVLFDLPIVGPLFSFLQRRGLFII